MASLWAPHSVTLCAAQSYPCQGHLSLCMPDIASQVYKCPQRAKCGHCHTCGLLGGYWAAEDRRQVLSQTQAGLSVLHKCQSSESSEPLWPWPPTSTRPWPSASTSTSMCSLLHWDSNNTHANLTSRCGAVGVSRMKVPLRRAEKEIKPAWPWNDQEKQDARPCLALSAANNTSLRAGWAHLT